MFCTIATHLMDTVKPLQEDGASLIYIRGSQSLATSNNNGQSNYSLSTQDNNINLHTGRPSYVQNPTTPFQQEPGSPLRSGNKDRGGVGRAKRVAGFCPIHRYSELSQLGPPSKQIINRIVHSNFSLY